MLIQSRDRRISRQLRPREIPEKIFFYVEVKSTIDLPGITVFFTRVE